MKRLLWITICIPMLLLCSCTPKEMDAMPLSSDNTVTVINSLSDADVWILPDTDENRHTTLWGTPSAKALKSGDSCAVALPEGGDEGRFLFRMIDTDGIYYAAGGIVLEKDQTLEIREIDRHTVMLEVTDAAGKVIDSYEVFRARL